MTNQEILEKAIQKAIDGGWQRPKYLEFTASDELILYNIDQLGGSSNWYHFKIRELLLNHDFAKALWGEEWKSAEILERLPKVNTYRIGTIEPCWQFHLKGMVVAEDPIAYLDANMPK